jgi:hypothetical protein
MRPQWWNGPTAVAVLFGAWLYMYVCMAAAAAAGQPQPLCNSQLPAQPPAGSSPPKSPGAVGSISLPRPCLPKPAAAASGIIGAVSKSKAPRGLPPTEGLLPRPPPPWVLKKKAGGSIDPCCVFCPPPAKARCPGSLSPGALPGLIDAAASKAAPDPKG